MDFPKTETSELDEHHTMMPRWWRIIVWPDASGSTEINGYVCRLPGARSPWIIEAPSAVGITSDAFDTEEVRAAVAAWTELNVPLIRSWWEAVGRIVEEVEPA